MNPRPLYKINIESETIKTNGGYFPLNIVSVKSAILLNFVFYQKLNNCSFKRYGSRYCNDEDYIKGGGLFVKGRPQITIDDMNELGIYFNDTWKMNSYLRADRGHLEILPAIKDKLANELKYYWKICNVNNTLYLRISTFGELNVTDKNNNKLINTSSVEVVKDNNDFDCVVISENEYRSLYEFLKNRSKERTIRKYGEEAYNSMIGKKIEDQFLLSAIETIKNEINNANKEYENNRNTVQSNYEAVVTAARADRDIKLNELAEIRRNKIAELKNQIAEMQKIAIG